MSAATSSQNNSSGSIAPAATGIVPPGEIDTRLTGSPQFAPGVNQNAPNDSGNGEDFAAADGHDKESCVNQAQVIVPPEHAAEIAPFLVELGVNLQAAGRGRKNVFDDFLRGRLVSLLAMGLSIRQSAAALGLSHNAVWKELKRNPELEERINSARFQAQIEPLLVILRESKRSWRAATWVLGYLQRQMANHEETPDEKRARVRAQTVEMNEQNHKDQEEGFRQWREQTAKERRREDRERERANRATRMPLAAIRKKRGKTVKSSEGNGAM